MGYPDLIHLVKSPHWWVWLLIEAALIIGAVLLAQFTPQLAYLLSPLLFLIALFLFVALSFGIAFSATVREALVRPEAVVETRHVVFLVLGGLIGVLIMLYIVVGTIVRFGWAT